MKKNTMIIGMIMIVIGLVMIMTDLGAIAMHPEKAVGTVLFGLFVYRFITIEYGKKVEAE